MEERSITEDCLHCSFVHARQEMPCMELEGHPVVWLTRRQVARCRRHHHEHLNRLLDGVQTRDASQPIWSWIHESLTRPAISTTTMIVPYYDEASAGYRGIRVVKTLEGFQHTPVTCCDPRLGHRIENYKKNSCADKGCGEGLKNNASCGYQNRPTAVSK